MLLVVLLLAADPAPAAPSFSYKLSAPDQVLELDKDFQEISGVSLAKDGESLWAVCDDKGSLFRIAIKDGTTMQTIELSKKKADFEDVTVAGDNVVVARSDGTLLVVDPKAEKEEQKIRSQVPLACDLEGLAYEPNKDRLLMACKTPSGGKSNRNWPIYSMSLRTKEMPKNPTFLITAKVVKGYVDSHPDQRDVGKEAAKDLGPSALAVHPKTGEIYMLSSRASLLMVLDGEGKLLHMEHLSRDIAAQPEGIAFTSDGTLLISSEGRNKKPMLLRFVQKDAKEG